MTVVVNYPKLKDNAKALYTYTGIIIIITEASLICNCNISDEFAHYEPCLIKLWFSLNL